MTEIQCAILAGGRGTRMQPFTDAAPKAMLPVAGRPFIDHQLQWLVRAGVTDVVMCIGHLGEQIEDFVADGQRWGLRVAYEHDGDVLRGTAGALREAHRLDLLHPHFAVVYGDSYLPVSVSEVVAGFLDRDAIGLMTVFRNQDRYDRSNVSVRDGAVVRYEKGLADPAAEGVEHIDYGLSVFARDALIDQMPAEDPVDLAPVLGELARAGQLAAFEVTERFYEVGSPEGLAELERLLSAPAQGGSR